MQPVKRFLYPSGHPILLDPNGLLISSYSTYSSSNLISLNKVVDLPGGILLAEGGMGKTIFMEQLKESLQEQPVNLFKLGEYTGDYEGIKNDIEEKLTISLPNVVQTFIFDGLDEAPELAGTILRKIRKLSNASVWIASRDIDAIRVIQKECSELKSYSLAPLSETDLRNLASQVGVDGDRFLRAASHQGILPICAKPIGCELALSEFCEGGLAGVTQRDLWKRGIERICDETLSSTRQLTGPPRFSLNEIIHCAAWISMSLAISDNHFVWSREQSYCPQFSLSIFELSSHRFPAGLIRATLERGVFSPLGDGRIGFSHLIYKDYLAALGFSIFIPVKNWISLLINEQRDAIFPQRVGIAAWLATYNTGFLSELSAIQPELLLSSNDSVQNISPEKLCNVLLERADNLSVHQRRSDQIYKNLYRLKDSRIPNLLRNCLLNKESSPAAIELAISIAENCEYAELADILADRVLDTKLSLQERVDAGYAVCKLGNDVVKRRLKSLLPLDPASDSRDNLRGIVLRACWPECLTPNELILHLIKPQKLNYGGAYSSFLSYDLPVSLELSLNSQNAEVLLEWAVQYINEREPFDYLGKLSRTIYSFCWQWAKTPVITKLLANGYIKALSYYKSPFLQDQYKSKHIIISLPKREDILKNIESRFAVLEAILSSSDVNVFRLADIPVNDFPLYTQDDLPRLFKRIFSNPNGSLSNQWTSCIKSVLGRAILKQYANLIDHLHELRPDLIDDSHKLSADMDAIAKHYEDMNLEFEKKDEKYEKELKVKQRYIDLETQKVLSSPNIKPDRFADIAYWLNTDKGTYSLGAIDLCQSCGWGKLTANEKNKVINLAHNYLAEANIQPTELGQVRFTELQALTILRLHRPEVFASFTQEVWQKCAVEVLKINSHEDAKLITPLFNFLSEKFPNVATDALLEVLSQELQQNSTSIIHDWGSRLTEEQAIAMLDIANASTTNSQNRFRIINDLAQNGKAELVCKFLDKLFRDGWAKCLDTELHELRKLAFELSPMSYILQLLDAILSDVNWGRQWFESFMIDSAFCCALFSCEVNNIAEVYIWLHNQYPTETCPRHDIVYTPGPLDKIHDLKNNIINHLTQSGREGSSIALEKIYNRFPSDNWLKNCIIEAKSAEQSNSISVLSIAQLKELCEQRANSRRLVNSDRDLLNLIMTSLDDYHIYLQGDTPAIGDLWNTEMAIRPKDEEFLSDHLKRYLDLRLTTDIIINREVQIRRKQYSKGVPGSRTDIWVQATDENGDVLTLCIEVKCNWNSSAKAALKNQLIDKYMAGRTATAGILLLGWFECNSWDNNDNRCNKATNIWPDSETAQNDLQNQALEEQRKGNNVSTIVIDCTLK